ncbi:DUF3971 domain-containing protein [Kordiimonas aquimaris]|uniref:DUF3971 domain-containing protein n=1 Tax=Kordiimonas aquimaris TaxID=707591 RepID=UPI0021CFA926|nr:DUF3971 domain-containing protein [Kordiimonas aquimaris]
MKKIGSALVSICLSLLTVVALLVCILMGRLLFGPIDIGFAREEVLARTSALLPGWDVQFGEASIGWDWASVRPWIILENTRLVDRRARLTADLPHVELGIGFRGILAGVGVSTVSVDRAAIRVTDIGGFSDSTDDSLFDDLFDANGIPKLEVFVPLTEGFNRFSLRLLSTVPELERINFDGMSVRIFRGATLSDASINLSNLALSHVANDLNLTAQMDIAIGGNPISTRLRGRARPIDGDLSLVLGVSDFYPSSFSADVGLPEFLKYIQLPIDLSLELDLDATVGLQSADIGAVLGDGQLSDQLVFPENPQIRYGVIGGHYDVRERTFAINEIDFSTDSGEVKGSGLLYWQGEEASQPGLQLSLSSETLQITDILKYWPRKFHPDGRERGARAWVAQHIIEGLTQNVSFTVDMTPDGVGTFQDASPYQLTFDFTDLDTLFLKTMPPITDGAGSARLTKQQMTIDLNEGILTGLPVGGSSVLLDNIHIPYGGVGEFNIFTRGDLQTLMRLIDNPPLLVAQKANLDISRLGGNAAVRAIVKTPLLKEVLPGSTTYDVTAQATDVYVQNLLDGEGLKNAQLSLRVNQDNLVAAGQGLLNEVPVNLRWNEDFALARNDNEANTTLIVLSASVDENDMRKLGVDVADYLTGKVQAEASFEGRNLKFSEGTFAADASTAQLKIGPVAWSKPVGEPANVAGSIIFDDAGTHVAPLSVQGEDIDLDAMLQFGRKGEGTFAADITARKVGRSSLTAKLVQDKDQALNVSVDADVFDIAPFLASNENTLDTNPDLPPKSTDDTSFDLSMRANSLLLENGEEWRDGSVDLTFSGGAPLSLKLNAHTGINKTPILVELNDTPDADTGARPLNVTAGNGGQVLRALGLFAHVDGGELQLTGSTIGWGKSWHLSGLMEIKDSQLFPSTDLGEAVTEGTISAIDSYLSDGPLTLDVLDVPFDLKDEILTIDGLKTNGPSMGLTMEGQIAAADRIININGVVVPAYGINSLLGNIPLVGGLFTGGEGKGLFGVTYRVKGSISNPDVTVSALSGLAPGFLRLLFEGQKGRVADVDAVTPTKPEEPDDLIDDEGSDYES